MNEISVNYKTAAELNQKIIFTAQMAQQNLFKMCCMLKRMRDEKLYKELGYPNFEDYCENEVGFSSRNARNYISVIENINEEKWKSISAFGMTKLSLLASLSESQQEEIQQNVNVEDISVRKLKEEIARLKEESESAGQRAENERQRRISAETDLLSAKSKNRSLTHDLDAANSRINELESRPVEVAVETDTKTLAENERLQQELEQARETITEMERTDTSYELKTTKAAVRNLDRQLSELAQESANEQNRIRQKYQKEINALREQLENSAYTTEVETVEVPATKEVFEAYCSIVKNAYAMLIDFVKSIGSDKEYTRAVDKMLDYRIVHVGINAANADEARSIAGLFSQSFGFANKEGDASIFSSDSIEIMKANGRGTNGHIAIGTKSVPRAMYRMEKAGVKFDETSSSRAADGHINFIYLKGEMGGFAVHLKEV